MRKKGQLDAAIKRACDEAHRNNRCPRSATTIAHRAEFFLDDNREVSVGAVTATLRRWEDIGFIEIHPKPVGFAGYTTEAFTKGMTQLKLERRALRREQRKAHNGR